jgi:anion-transporting  ArsA/GET3 family ATPase
LKRLAQFVGSQFLEDIAAFLSDFQGVLGGFLIRAESVSERLRGADVAFVLVLAPETPAVDEALFFQRRLHEAGLHLEAFVANRVHERPGLTDVDELGRHLRARPALAGVSEDDIEQLAATLGRAAIDMSRVCDGEDCELARLRAAAPNITLLQVPRLDHDVATLAALAQVGSYLAPEGRRPTPR